MANRFSGLDLPPPCLGDSVGGLTMEETSALLMDVGDAALMFITALKTRGFSELRKLVKGPVWALPGATFTCIRFIVHVQQII